MLKYNYVIVGAGRQGVASAYDLAKFGEAKSILLTDSIKKAAEKAAANVNGLIGADVCKSLQAEASDKEKMLELFKEADVVISAVPYYFNLDLTKWAIQSSASFVDLGGNTQVVKSQLELSELAKVKNVSVVPDCGMGPGLNISLINYVFNSFDAPEEIVSYVGGLPLNPKPPWNYELIFNINGLTNEYYGKAFAIENYKTVEIPGLSEVEEIQIKNFGTLEAAVTTGGLSTAPFTYAGKLKTLRYKTLRYPGHWELFRAYSLLGLFDEEPIEVKGKTIAPRDFYHALLEPKLKTENPRDVGILHIVGSGIKAGKKKRLTIDLVEKFDEGLGFTAMQKLTGWHASIMAHLAARSVTPKGAFPVEQAADGAEIIKEAKKRGFEFKEIWEEI